MVKHLISSKIQYFANDDCLIKLTFPIIQMITAKT